MKNVLYIVIDALSQRILDDYPFKDELFINQLKEKSYYFTSMYTTGPYTEACLSGIICGQDPFDYGAYLYSYNKCPERLHDFFEMNRYSIYTSSFKANDSTGYREDGYYCFSIYDFPMYRQKDIDRMYISKTPLSSFEYEYIKNVTELFLSYAVHYYYGVINNNEAYSISLNYINCESAQKQFVFYHDCLLKMGDNNFLTSFLSGNFIKKLPNVPIELDADFLIKRKECNLPFYKRQFHKVQKKHIQKKKVIKCTYSEVNYLKDKNSFGKILRFFYRLARYLIRNPINDNISQIENVIFDERLLLKKPYVSMKKRTDDLIDFIKKQKGNFYINIQPQDLHPKSSFYTYDIEDAGFIRDELDDALKFAKRIPKNIKCNIYSFLSIRYIDKHIKRIFDCLKMQNIADNTLFIVTSDHGYWDYFDKKPISDNPCFMDEQRILIPCIIHDPSNPVKTEINTLLRNCCLPSSIVMHAGFPVLPVFSEPYTLVKPKEYIVTEYFNTGSPDLFKKNIYYLVHNKYYKLLIIGVLGEELTKNNCVSFYDLQKDKDEIFNMIKRKKYTYIINEMFEYAFSRHILNRKTNKEAFYSISQKDKTFINIAKNYNN